MSAGHSTVQINLALEGQRIEYGPQEIYSQMVRSGPFIHCAAGFYPRQTISDYFFSGAFDENVILELTA